MSKVVIGAFYSHPEISFLFMATSVSHRYKKVRGLWWTKKGQLVSRIHDSIDLNNFRKIMILIPRH